MDDVLPSSAVVQRIHAAMPLVALEAAQAGETAQRWGYAGELGLFDASQGEIGVISSVTQAFCGYCNRARLSTEGRLYLCLFASLGHDLRSLVRGHAGDSDIAAAIAGIWTQRSDRYSEQRGTLAVDPGPPARRIEMSYIGG
jgi:cyclic pyranopterin phosphate synthase